MNGWVAFLCAFLLVFASIFGVGFLLSTTDYQAKELTNLQNLNSDLHQQHESLSLINQDLTIDVNRLSYNLEILSQERDNALVLVRDYKSKINELEDQLSVAQNTNSQVKFQNERLNDEIVALKNQFTVMTVERDRAVAECTYLKEDLHTSRTGDPISAEPTTNENRIASMEPPILDLDLEHQWMAILLGFLMVAVTIISSIQTRVTFKGDKRNEQQVHHKGSQDVWIKMTRDQARTYAKKYRKR